MKKTSMKKWTAAIVLGAVLAGAALQTGLPASAAATAQAAPIRTQQTVTQAPKYVFLFIGDGMSYPQIQTAADYQGAMQQEAQADILSGPSKMPFMNFPAAGSATTYDSTSFCPDSASTATSLSTGHKTYSGVINMDEQKKVSYETIAEKVKAQLGYKVGIVSSVNLNHATPAAFYAHQPSRNNYYEIGQELVASGFDYFAGGGLLSPEGKDGQQTSLYTLAEQAGYQVITTQSKAGQLAAQDGKALVIGETLADSDALSYDNDRRQSEWALKDYVRKGIEVLDNDKGFFMMVEGGKIDWACHANDAGSAVADTLALNDAINEAVAFYNNHPQETLIVVTGDHETGGLTIGYAGTDYDTFLTNLDNQAISYAKFDSDYVANYKKNKTSFETVLQDIKTNFGLMSASDAEASANGKLVLTDYELAQLKAAYDKTMSGATVDKANQREYVLYGTYEPLTVTITHLLNNKSGVNFASYAHTGLPVPVFAQGVGYDLFKGYYDNTDIYNKMAVLLKVQ